MEKEKEKDKAADKKDGGEVKTEEKPEEEKKVFVPMKKGDYSIHILVEEVKNLISKNEDIPYPVIKISVDKDSKRTKEVPTKVDTYFYGEHFYFDCLNMNPATLDSAKIVIEVYDKANSDRCDYLGIYEIDFGFVYNNKDHTLMNYWVALANPESDDFSKIRGYLRFCCSILHTDDNRVELVASTGSGKDGMVALPPQIKAVYYQIDLQIFKAKGVPDMDSLFVNKAKRECNAYIVIKYMGVTLKTTVVDMKDNILIWNEMLSIPVSFPIVSQKICCSIWDHDKLGDDIIGSFEINVNDILGGQYDQFRYINIYGAPLNCSGPSTNMMNENSEIGSLWKGKLLVRAEYKKTEFPKARSIEIPVEDPILDLLGKLREKILWNFEINIERALFLPFPNDEFMIKVIIDEQECEFQPKKAKNGMIDWGITKNISLYALSDNINEISDVFIYLVNGDKDKEKNRICFQRMDAIYFTENSEFFVMKFYPDPAIGKVAKVSESGLLKLRIRVSCQGNLVTKLADESKVSKGGPNKLTNEIPAKIENAKQEDSDEEDMDAMMAKKRKEKLAEISKAKDAKVENKGVPIKGQTVTVIANIHQTRNLIPGDDNGLSDPFVKVHFVDKMKQTSVKWSTINGIWNEPLVFNGLVFDIKDEKTFPVAFIEVLDKDTFSKDDDLGFTYCWITDTGYKINSLERILPTWVNLHLPLSNKKQGQILVSFYIIEESNIPLMNQIPKLDISPITELYSFEINVLGLRGLQPKGIIPIKKAYIAFDLNSISVLSKKKEIEEPKDNKNSKDKKKDEEKKDEAPPGDESSQKAVIHTEPKESGPDPTINTIISFENFLPKDKVFTPDMLCLVNDYILAGLGNNLLGCFEIQIGKMVEDTEEEMNRDRELCKKLIEEKENEAKREEEKILPGAVVPVVNASLQGDGMEEKKLVKPEEIIPNLKGSINNNRDSGASDNLNDLVNGKLEEEINTKKVQDHKHKDADGKSMNSSNKAKRNTKFNTTFKGMTSTSVTCDGEEVILLPHFKEYRLPKVKKEEVVKDDKNDKTKEIPKEEIKPKKPQNIYIKDESKEAQKKKEDEEKIERETVYVIEDESKKPDIQKYVELGYHKVSTLKENQTLEEAVEAKNDPYKKHYRRIFQRPLEDPKTGLGLTCPFIKLPLHIGAYEDKEDLNQIFKALSDVKNKVLKEFIHKNDEHNKTVSSIGHDIELRDVGFFKGLIRINEKQKMRAFKEFSQEAIEKYGFNHLNKYDNLSKKLLVSKEVLVRVYVIELNQLAEKDFMSASDPYLKIILGDTVIDESKNHYDDMTDCVIRKSFDLTTFLPGASNLKIQVWDWDPLFSDELIGETVIDIEDRYYDYKWQELLDKPIEVRPLLHPDFTAAQGYAKLWVEVVDKSDKKSAEKFDISLNPDAKAELRLIVWETREIPSMDVEDCTDMYCNAFIDIETKQSTDLHFRCQGGQGSFNWRMLFPLQLPRTNKSNYLNIQLYDKDFFSSDDYICNNTLNLEDFLKRIYVLDTPIKFSEDYWNSMTLEEKQKMFETTDPQWFPEWCKDDKFNKENKFWLHLKRPNTDGNTVSKCGAVLISLEAMPQWKADICKVGLGRDEPNCNPYCPPPFGRFEWSLNPFKMFNQCVGPKMRKKICQLICVVACLIWCLFLLPYIILYLVSELTNPFNWINATKK